MSDSFANAASRHRTDATHLADNKRFQNAGHLIGFAAECLVKSILQQQKIEIDPASGLRVHFPNLRDVISKKGHGRLMGPLLPILNGANFLMGWRAELRYEEDISEPEAQRRWEEWFSDVQGLFIAAGKS